jgi:hypothetical protein
VNCFEFRRLCLSIPNSGDPGYMAHADECNDCKKYAEGVRRIDQALVEALDVPIPEDLVARLKLRTVLDSEQNRRNFGMRFAIAASVVLAVSAALFGYRTWSVDQQYQSLTQAVVTHIEHEHVALDLVTTNAPDELARMFVDYGATDAEAVGTVRFTTLCPVNGEQAIHAVLSTPTGPVTLIFVPGVELPEVRDALHEGLNNRIVPMGNGAMILSGGSTAPFDEVTNLFRQAVEWSI